VGSREATAEVLQIAPNGLRLRAGGTEYLLAYAAFPAFENAPVAHALNVVMPDSAHLRWPDLGVTIPLDALEAVDPLAFLK
jgi:hypothetical protein